MAERRFVELGGANPDQSLSQEELCSALTHAVTFLADQQSPILLKLYQQARDAGDLSEDPEIENLLADTVDP